jgi:hypothetical protein
VTSVPPSVPSVSPALSALAPAPRTTSVVNGKTVDVFDPSWRITILAPTYDAKVTTLFHRSVLACRSATAHYRQPDGSVREMSIIAGEIMPEGDSHVDRTRNMAMNIWIEKNPYNTVLSYSWDVDIEMFPNQLMELYRLALLGHRFLCGVYAMKCLRPTFVANVPKGFAVDPQTHLAPLLHGGTGSMMLHRDVPLALREQHPLVKPFKTAPNHPFANQKWWAYFHSGVQGEKLPPDAPLEKLPDWDSEDWQLCRDWQDLGGQVMGATHIKLRHHGMLTYPPEIPELVDAVVTMLEQNHPIIDIAKLRTAVAAYQPALPKAA